MTTFNLPGARTLADTASRRRRGILTAWGVFLIVLGTLLSLAVTIPLFAWVSNVETSTQMSPHARRSAPRPPAMSMIEVVGIAIGLTAGAGTLWTGIACCLKRRWVRPVVVIVCGFVCAWGVLNFVAAWLMLPGRIEALRAPGTQSLEAPSALIAAWITAAVVLFALEAVLPYLMLRSFLNARTARLLDELDPQPTWLDRKPMPVLAWTVLCALVAVSCFVRISEPTLAVFVAVLSGAPAVVGLATVGVLLAWGGWRCYCLDRLAWIVTFVLLAGLRVSSAVYLWTGGELLNLSPVEAGTTALSHVQQITVPADWVMQTLASLEAGVVIAFGLLVARYFSSGYRFGVVSSGDA